MKKTLNTKTLRLTRETVRSLSSTDLVAAVGGSIAKPITQGRACATDPKSTEPIE
jgi:hypothetical protein